MFYYRLCESIRIGDKTRHHILLNLGDLTDLDETDRKLLANRIEELYKGHTSFFNDIAGKVEQLARKFYIRLREKNKQSVADQSNVANSKNKPKNQAATTDMQRVDINTLQHDEVRETGAEHLSVQALEELKLPSLLQELDWSEEKINMALTHIVSRAVYPASEHKTAQWIQSSSAIKELLFKEKKTISYQQLYQLSKELYAEKEALENHLTTCTNELFDLEDNMMIKSPARS